MLSGLLGLRGIAALAIVLSHISYFTGIDVPAGFSFIERDFRYGAQLFFVLSAFSLMHSTERTMNRPDWAREYFIKRYFRIAPLFYFMLILMVIERAVNSNLPDFTNILLNVFFVFGFLSDLKFGIVRGGWTIGVEMIFYVLFPILLMVVKTKKQALILMLLAMVISYTARVELHTQYFRDVVNPHPAMDWNYYTFLPNLHFFAVGIYAYRFEQELMKNSSLLKFVIPLAALIPIVLLMLAQTNGMLKNPERLELIVWAFGFGALCVWQSAKPSFWSANKFFEYLGERSFSIYLLHPGILYFSKSYIVGLYTILKPSVGEFAYFFCAVMVVAMVLVLSEITYRAIEVTGVKLGRRIIESMRGKAVA